MTSLQFTREKRREQICQLFEMLALAEFLLTADQRLSNCFFIGTNHFFEEEKGGFHSRAHLHLPASCFPKKYPAQFPPLKKVSRAG